jgi:hypothetical protein
MSMLWGFMYGVIQQWVRLGQGKYPTGPWWIHTYIVYTECVYLIPRKPQYCKN